MGGVINFWNAIAIYFKIRNTPYWVYKTDYVLSLLPKGIEPKVKVSFWRFS